ncbi:hypothetical protein QJQ45_025369 [Haematococcus lacustris]|nr:hypothetical protein QJQ45_025369 [Haematococcus lacustris]
MLVWYVLQFYRTPLRPYAREWWGVFAGLYVFLHFLHWCLTLRDGYMVSLTHMLKLPAIFRASTLRGDATCWLSAPMHMKWKLLFLNGLFWLLVFAMKLPFDYFVIAKPVVVPLRVVLYRHWLSCDGGASKWYPTELGNTGKYPFPCLGGDWLLLAGRVAPFMVIIFMDTALFYQIAITIFGLLRYGAKPNCRDAMRLVVALLTQLLSCVFVAPPLRGMFKLDLGVLTSWDEVTKEFYRAPARWWHKCMSELGNDNQLAQLKQSMFVEDSATGHVTQVSDGLMFKKAVLTPEEILGKKVHFNGRGKSSAGGSMSGDAAQRSGPSGVIDRMRALVQDATHSDKPERKTAMLPSSSNRTRVAMSEKKRDEEAHKRDERHKEDEAKAQAHKAAIVAGKGHLIDKEVMGISQSGSMAPSVAATDGEEVQQQAAGIKGIFNRFVHSDAGEGDAVDKMAADAAKLKKSKANTGPTPSPVGRQHKVALSVSQAPKSGRTRPVTAAVSAAPSRAASAAPSRAASEWGGGYDGDSDALEVESVAGSGFGGHLGDRRQLAGGSNAASKADGKVSSILGKILSRKAEQMDEVDKMAADARRAALQKKEATPGMSGQMAASAYPAAPLMTGTPMPSSLKTNSPNSGSTGRKKVSLSAVAPEEDNRPSSSRASGGARMPAVLLAASDRPPPTASSPAAAAPPSGPVAEAWGPLRPTATTSPEIVAAPPTTLSERHAAGRSRFSRSGGQSGPLAESLLPSQEVELSSSRQHGSTWADLPTAQHTSSYWRRTSSSSLTSDSSGSAAPLMAAPQATVESASQRKQRLRAVRKVPGKLLAMNAGPASLWWLGQALQNAETVEEPPTAAGSNQHDGSSVHVTVPAAQPLGEGVEDARPGLGPLPPLVSSPHATASTSARGHLESELDDLFGKPIDSRTNSMTQEDARPLPHTTPATPGPAVQPALALPHLLVPGSPQDMPSPIGARFADDVGGTEAKAKPTKLAKPKQGQQLPQRSGDSLFNHLSSFKAMLDTEDVEAGGTRRKPAANQEDDSAPLLGGFMSKLNLWKKNDVEAPFKGAKPKQPMLMAKRMQSVQLTVNGKQQLPSAGSAPAAPPENDKTGLTAEDLAIDDVHYQMMMWNAFASAWDEIIDDIRGADLISDKEIGMLKFVRLDLGSRHYGLRPILLPTFFYAGQVRKVVDTGMVTTAQIMVLSELRVLCVWLGCQIGLLSGKHAHVITSAPFCSANVNVKHALHRKKFYNAGVQLIGLLEDMCSRQEVPFEMRDFAGHLYTLLTSLEGECFAVTKAHEYGRATDEELELSSIMLEVVQEMKRELARDSDRLKVIFKNALSTSATANFRELLKVVRVIKRMLLATVAEATPQSEETQRCLGFFINSLGHPHLDRPCSLEKMWSWTIMTPLYEEDVLYPLESAALAKELGLKAKKMTDLLTEGDDSVSLMAFLKATFPDEWENFKERMKSIIPDINVKELSEIDFAPGNWLYEYRLELQMWASCRGQLLGRTANGMMRNEKALRVLAKLEHPMPPTMTDLEYQRWIDKLVCSRFEMLVTPQTYGKNRDSRDVRLKWLSKSMDLMLQRHPRCLKAAFLEKAEVDGMGTVEFSVLIKGRDPEDLNQLPHLDDQPVYEQYRVRLPQNRYSSRGVILGEGKPENQNHAVIFAHMEGIQAIDMNQDGYLCEWLKSRNLLAELQPSSRGDAYLFCDDDEKFTITSDMTGSELHSVVRSRQAGSVFTAIVGFREYIFSESAGALGRFAAATEYAFGTITQRTMTHPARVRLHYGHPDIFNKLFVSVTLGLPLCCLDGSMRVCACEQVMTRGGMSKATRLLHLTEDVFCGCNHTLRGARIRYKEYISCGKGRDMGFDSINGFNFKIAGGGGEWAISRESYRMGTRLDFFRLMSFYHAGVGAASNLHRPECKQARGLVVVNVADGHVLASHLNALLQVGFYVNSWFTFLAVYLNTYALLLFAWARATEIQAGALQNVYNVQQVLQLGTLALIPYAGQLMLENGVVRTALTLFSQIATGSLLFYTFQQQTVAQSFAYDMKYGSGKYVGTGRGFNLVSLEFVKIFSLYCRSHLYMGFEMIYALTTLYLLRDCASCNMGALTWLEADQLHWVSLAMQISHNYLVWRRWMDGDVDAVTGSNWYTWNSMQLEKVRNDGGNNTDVWLNHLGTLFTTTPYMLMALGSASRLDICLDIVVGDRFNRRIQAVCNPYVIFFMATSAIWFMVWLTITLRAYWINLANHKPWRIYKWFVTLGLVVFIIVFFVGISRFMTGSGFEAMLIVIYANWNLLVSFHKLATPMLSQNNNVRAFSDWFFYTVDSMIGYLMFILMALLAFIGVVGLLQMKLLFNETFSEQVKHAKIGRAMKEQKVGFDNSRGSQPVAAPSAAVPDRVVSAGTVASMAVSIRSINQSEHRYT